MKRISLHFLFLLGALLLCASSVWSQSVLVFPRVIAATGEYTGLAVSNPTSSPVSITFTAYQADGTMTTGTGVQNPVTMSIPASGQLAKQYAEIFGGSGSFNGWVQASSASSGLTGYFLNGNTALTDLDGAATVAAASDLVLPIAIEDGVAETEVTIVNVNSSPATAVVTVYGLDGGVIQTTTVNIAGLGLIRQTLSSLMGAGDYSTASHIRIQSALPLNALDVVVNYLVDGSSIRRETVEVAGQQPSGGQTYILPQFVTGGGWLSLIGLANDGGVSQTVTLTAYQEDGTLWPLTSNPVQVTLPANGGVRTTAAELFGFPVGTLNTGWIQVQSPLGYLSAYVGYGNTSTPSFGLAPAAESSTAWRYGVFPQVAEGGGFFTGLTLVNPGQTAATINFYTMRPDGSTVGESTFTLGAGQRIGELFRELLPADLGQVGGWGYVRSSQPIVGVSLLGTVNGYALANVPKQGPAADFQPAAQTTGAITGTVDSNGLPVLGVQITLSGPVTATVATDGSGDYIFPQLPAGSYQVTAIAPGAQFVPASIGVTLNGQNVSGQNFIASGLTVSNAPVVQMLSPASAFAGTSALNMRVMGSNFTPASVVMSNAQPLQTSFINAGELEAILPAAQLTTAQTVNITVVTPAPGGGQSGALGFLVNPAPSDPLIVGSAATQGNPAGVAVDAKRLHVLVTNESSDTVSVIDLKTLQGIAAIGVGRSPAEGIAVDAVRDIALVANPGTDDVSVIDLPTNTETKRISLGSGSFPLGIAIDDTVSRAFVANEEAGTVSVIDLNALAVVGTIPAGTEPSNIAVNTGTHMGLVTNRGANTVTVFDTSTMAVTGLLNVGQQPRGIAVNPVTNQAVVANSNGNDVSIVNLATQTIVATVTVGTGPTEVAVFPLTNSAIVTNSGITRTQTNVGVPGSISIINLATATVSQQIPVGASAFGIDVDAADQQVVVADYGSNDVTVVRIPNPVPQVTDVEPRTFPAGGGALTITVTGTGFLPTSVVTVNGQALPTTFVSATVLQAQVSPAVLNQLLGTGVQQQTGKGEAFSATSNGFTIGVSNPGPGGGNSPTGSAGLIQAANAAPVLLSISPASTTVGTGNLTLTLSGNNFNGTSVVNFGGSQQSPSSVTATSMTVVIPQASLSAGTVVVSVSNPAPGGGTSGALPFQVNGQANPTPSIVSVQPLSISAGSVSTVVTVQGTGFIGTTTAVLGGVAGTVSGNTATFNLGAAVLASSGTLAGLIVTPAPGGGAASFSVNVLNALPTVSGFSPVSAAAGTAALTLSVSGANFGSGSQITVAGTPIPTTFVSSTTLSGTMTASFLQHAGNLTIGVTNPAPGGGSAAAANVFTVTIVAPAPTITGVSSSSVTAGQTITVIGTNFGPTSVILLGGVALPTTEISPTELMATIPTSVAPGAVNIAVQNSATSTTSAQSSAPVSITITTVTPVVSSVTPSSGTQGAQISITVSGTNFVNGAAIDFGGSTVTTTFISTTTLAADVLVPNAGGVSVSVTNPGGAASNSVTFQSILPTQPAPTVTSVSPSSAQVGSSTPIAVTGTNFISGAVITFNGGSVVTTFVNSTTLTATVTAPSVAGPVNVSVTNPGGAVSNSVSFQIVASTSTPQTIAFDAIPHQILGISPFPLAAQASSGLPVGIISTTPAVCKTAGGLAMLLSAGTCSITASQPGNATYSPATPVIRSFSVSVANPSVSFTAATGSPFPVGSGPYSVAVGDFNGDGYPDIATANSTSHDVTVLLGSLSGVFTAATGSPFTVGTGPYSVAVGDFNGDGIPDLVTANEGSGNVTVLLGNGSGGFTPTDDSPFTVGSIPYSVAVGDFNGDGIQDLATANGSSGNVTVLLGNGSGGFTPAGSSPFAVGSVPYSVAVGDFNRDGIQDLAVANGGSGNVTVLLGNGSGGFTPAGSSPFTVGSSPYSVAVGDFNGDGIPDLVTANEASSNVTVLLGNGSGGFTAAAGNPFAVDVHPYSVVVGDFNGDGIQDLATANYGDDDVTVLLGNGSGGFAASPQSPFEVGLGPWSVATGDFNGDGIEDLVTANFSSNNVTLLLGLHRTSQTITFGELGNVTFGVLPFTINASASSELQVSFVSTTSAVCTVTGNTVTIAGVGLCSITASQAGNANYAAAVPVVDSFTVNPAAQSPTFSSISPASASVGATNLAATITGTNLTGATTVTFSATGVTASITAGTATSVSILITVASGAPIGTSDVTITATGGAATLTGGFMVNPSPAVTAISPIGATQGQGSTPITLTGTNLQGTTAIQFFSNGVNDTGITVTGVSAIPDGTTVTATANISGSAALSYDSLSLTSNGGAYSTGLLFNVYAPESPAIYTLSPSQATLGATVSGFTITGASLGTITGLSFLPQVGGVADAAITVQNFSASANSITADLTIGISALIGPHFIQLNTSNGPVFTSAVFNVSTGNGTIVNNLNPSLIHRGDTGTAFSVSGSNLASITGIQFYNPDGTQETLITSSGFAATASTISVNLTLDPNMPVGARTIALNFGEARILTTLAITVETQAAQGNVYVNAITPLSGFANSSFPISLTGSNPSGITGFEFQADGNTDTNLAVSGFESSGNQSSATLSINSAATSGSRNLVLLPSAGGTLATNLTFNVLSGSGAVLNSLIPGQRVVNSGAFTMVAIGAGFTPGSGVTFNGTNYIGATTFIDAQDLSVNIPGSEITSIGAVNVSVQIPDPARPGNFLSSNTAVFNVVAATVTLSPNPVTMGQGGSFPVSVALNQAVTVVGGVDVNLSVDTPGIISFPALAHINQGATVATVNLTASAIGSTSLTATYGASTSTITVNVQATAPATINVTPASIILNAAGMDTLTVTRANANNSVPLSVTLNLNRTGYVNVPATVTIPATQSSVVVPISGIAPDPTPPVIVTASASGLQSGTTTQISVQLLQLQMTPALLVNPSSSASLVITVSTPAPSTVTAPCVQAGLCITLVSNMPGIASVPTSVLIPAGQTQTTAVVTGVNPGNTTVTATAPGGQVVSQIQVQNVNLSFVPGSATFFAGPAYAQSVTVIMSVTALAGGQTVNLSSSDTTIATVPASIVIPAGSTTVNATITGVGPGAATITASSQGLNSGIYNATVVAATALVDDVETVRSTYTGVRTQHTINISNPAPIGGIPVTITSSNPAQLLVAPCDPANVQNSSCTDTNSPQSAITLSIPTGQTYEYFDIVGQDTAQNEVRFMNPIGVVRDASGNVYIADYQANVIRRIDGTTGIITTFAGTGSNTQTGDNGPANMAAVGGPTGLTIYNNQLFIACFNHQAIRMIDLSSNTISTVVPAGTLSEPYQVAFNATGEMFIASEGNSRIYRLSPGNANGTLTVYAGGGVQPATTVGVAATLLSIGQPHGVAVDAQGNVYYSDYNNNFVNQISTTGIVARIAGNGTCTISGDVADAAVNGRLCSPSNMAYDPASLSLYISDRGNQRIVRVTLNATEPSATPRPFYRIAGSATGSAGCCGDGLPSRSSLLNSPDGLSVDSSENLLFGDSSNYRVRQVTYATGIINTLAGGGASGYTGDGQPALSNHLIITVPNFVTQNMPVDINQSSWTFQNSYATETTGAPFNVIVQANNNSANRMADATNVALSSLPGGLFTPSTTPLTIPINGTSATFAVTPSGAGDGQLQVNANINGNNTRFNSALTPVITVLPVAIPMLDINDSFSVQSTATGVRQAHFVRLPATVTGSPVQLSIVSSDATRVGLSKCYVTPSGAQPTDDQNSSCNGQAVGAGVTVSVPVGQNFAYFDLVGLTAATSDTRLNYPADVAVNGSGAVYVADYDNYVVRKLAGGVLSTFAGSGSSTPSLGGTALLSGMQPVGVTVDSAGNLYIASANGHVIYQVTPSGAISVIAGTQNSANFADGAVGTGKLNTPYQVAIGGDGSLYIADFNNRRVRKIAGSSGVIPLNGTMTTIAGGGSTTPANGVAATSATFGRIAGVAVDQTTGDVYFSDYDGEMVWKVDTAGNLTAIAGTGTAGYNGDQADATQAQLYIPEHLSLKGSALYIADSYNHRIRQVTTNLTPRPLLTVAGTTSGGFNGDGNAAIVSELYYPAGMTTDGAGNLYIADQYNQRIREVLASTGAIQTVIGDGNAGYAGDGEPGQGVTITASVTSGGVTELPVTIGVDVTQSQWRISSISGGGATQTTGSTFTFTVQTTNGNDRMAAATTVNAMSTAPSVFGIQTTPLTMPINTNSLIFTAQTQSIAGNGQLQVLPTGTSFLASALSSVITVLPVAVPTLDVNDSFGVQSTATGVRQAHFVRLPATVTGSPVQLSIVSSDATRVGLSKCYVTPSGAQPTDDQNPSCNGQPVGAGVTVSVPVGQNFAYFDLVGQATATSDTRLNYPADVAVDGSGAVYVADYDNYVIRRLSGGVLSTFAGSGSSTPSLGGTALLSGMQPVGVTVDSAGNLYIASANGHVIYQVTPSGAISVIAGTQNSGNFADGAVGTGKLNTPYQVAIGGDGSLYIADFNNRRVRKITSTTNGVIPLNGMMTTIAGGGATTPANGGTATAATFGRIAGVAVDQTTGDVYFSDYDGEMVWKVDTAGNLTAIAGTGTAGYNGDQADATQAQLYIPEHLSLKGSALYIADSYNHRIRQVTTNLTPRPLLTVAGTTSGGFNGDGNAAIVSELYYPAGMTTDGAGNLYIADQYNQRIREVLASNGTIQTVIGDGNAGYAGDGEPGQGVTITASVTSGGVTELPVTIGVDVTQSQWRISSISGGGATQTTGSTFTFTVQTTNGNDRMAAATTVNAMSTAPSVFAIQTTPLTMPINTNTVTFTAQTQSIAGNGQLQVLATGTSFLASAPSAVITVLPVAIPTLDINDAFGVQSTATGVRQAHFVRLPATVTSTPVQVSIVSSDASRVGLSKCYVTPSGAQPTDDQNSSCNGQAVGAGVTVSVPVGQNFAYFDLVGLTAATSDTRLNYPADVAVDGSGAVYVADYDNYVIRKLSGGVLSTFAGNGSSTPSLGGTALLSGMQPVGVTVDSAGNLYIASANGHVIYQVTPSGAISVIAGTQNSGNFADGAVGTGKLNTPYQVAIGGDGSLYIADFNNRRVRKIASTTNGVIPLNGTMTTIAGGGSTTPANGVAATSATFGRIAGVAVDQTTGDVYFSDYDGEMVWKVDTAGNLTAIAGTGTAGYNGDQADATQAQLYIPEHLSLKGSALYIADSYNHRIRQVTTNLTPQPLLTVAGTTSGGFNGDGNAAIVSELYYPAGMTTDGAGNLYIADQYNQRIREVLASNGAIQTVIGDGNAGYAGDGEPGQGVTITASVTSGGVTELPVTIGVDVAQSTWQFFSYSTSTTGPNLNFSVEQTSSVGTAMRMNSSTTFGITPNTANVLSLPATLTIPNNGTSVTTTTGTSTTIGSGTTQIIAQASSTGIALGATSNITVSPVFTSVTPAQGSHGATTPVTITGSNFLGATGIMAPAGITATITNVSTDGQTMSATINVGANVTPGAQTLTILVPTGSVSVNFTFTVQ